MDATSWTGLLYSLFTTPSLLVGLLSGIDWIALVIALLGPLLIFAARNEVRLRRLRQIQDFHTNFGTDKNKKDGTGNTQSPLDTNPSFEFVRSKYTADLVLPEQEKFDKLPEAEKLRQFISLAAKGRVTFAYRLFLSSLGFVLLSYVGFHIFISAICCGLQISVQCPVPGLIAGDNSSKLIVIGSLAFVGAYISSARALLARLAVFDLSSTTFLRITIESLASVLFAAILFAAFPDPLGGIGRVLTGGASDPATTGQSLPLTWIALAPMLGLIPQSSTKFLLVKLQQILPWVKTSDDRFVSITPIISLDVIDGIDYEIRFRLEDCGIYDIQNLATYNPILLHVETPFGIYQCIDWVAQAQLCHIVGLERFLTFRELNIRTIFDLERAIDSIDSPEEFDDIYLSVLMSPTSNLRKLTDIAKMNFMIMDGANARAVTVDEYAKWARERVSKDPELTSKAAEHLMTWITDDLHVRRLRRLWSDIANSLGQGSSYFPDSKRNQDNKPKVS
ncbi:hypothetical protein [Neorhizobium sp. IRS_2294]|uniref:hypothetical protein n=1 Tax=unclassified Neorhizobium TaxID=2629175 RepID=UPI003D29A5A2